MELKYDQVKLKYIEDFNFFHQPKCVVFIDLVWSYAYIPNAIKIYMYITVMNS